jgi:hypothetical protein
MRRQSFCRRLIHPGFSVAIVYALSSPELRFVSTTQQHKQNLRTMRRLGAAHLPKLVRLHLQLRHMGGITARPGLPRKQVEDRASCNVLQ